MVFSALLIAGTAFSIGAKTEKSKLMRLGLLHAEACPTVATTKKSKKQSAEKTTPQAPIVESLSGSIITKDATSITLKTADNATLVITLSPATTIGKTGTDKLASLFLRQSVTVSGTRNTDGTFLAQNIQASAPAK